MANNNKNSRQKTTKASSKKALTKITPAGNSRDRVAESNHRIITYTLLSVATAASCIALGFSIYNFCANRNPFFGVFIDGNSGEFSQGDVAKVASYVSPSVVSILTETRTTGWNGSSSTSSAAGTGVVVTSDGYVLTNKHVVEGAKKIQVVLDDGTTYSDVTLVGTDPLNDIAFIKINNVSDLKPVSLGDSKTLNIGQEVIAIGNALGQYQNSVTEGIISGTGRTITALDSSNTYYERLSDMIQTDASINAGNSGGPLVNAAGQVIGINTAVSASGNSIGFAIPINSVKGILKSLINTGKAERAYLGVQYVAITPDIAKEYNLSATTGAYLPGSGAVISGSPAESAGLKSGDIITKVNGVEVGEAGSLSTLIGEYTVGDTVDITYIRNGEENTVRVTLAAYNL